ncbi:LuxR family transcriptional regulator [Mycobacterium antarcticum]|uniref:helix-turn-helix transcriptional regulator n=1 Tax=Mycolicibacterium sp. TUM20985 TaxID=3023370 RepID=UPI002572BE47|nr:LuxR family transcriptional regulator [Mycolicibacterium sp. TUM20985]BDX34657.1 LuxR family transcriptional regulator [Mycolicibacterium sp. TUM20985]
MSAVNVARALEALEIARFLDAASSAPAALLLEGEPGIGKTTLWLTALDEARDRGIRVLSTRPTAAESVMAYTALADLLASVAPSAWADLAAPQRQAVDRIMPRTRDMGDRDVVTDQRAITAGFLSVVEHLAKESPLLLAIDDLQWLDSSSVRVLDSVGRRISGPVAMLGTVRTADLSSVSWFQSPKPDRFHRISLRPFSVGALHAVISKRLGRSYPRPTMLHIHQTSGGNPFYAIELARSINADTGGGGDVLPPSLTELVDRRIDGVGAANEVALLASSCLPAPTVDLVARAVDTEVGDLVELLEPAETQGIISLDGNRIRFSHPILAKGVYQRASPATRRAMHHRLAELIDDPESRARHLALAATTGDPATLTELDAAADIARNRGAPGAAAELVNLALALGGDTPQRRITLAGLHFNAGDSERARSLLEETIAALGQGVLRARARHLLGVVRMFDDSFTDAADMLQRALDEVGDDPAFRAEALVFLAFAQINSGRAVEASQSVDEAVELCESPPLAHLLSQALSMRTTLRFMHGDGLDRESVNRAVELQNHDVNVPMAIRANVQSALLSAWNGELDSARDELAVIKRRSVEYGEDGDLIFATFHIGILSVWRGEFDALAAEAEEAMERALQLNGDVPRYVALTVTALWTAHAGEVEEARRTCAEGLAAGLRSGAANLSGWPVMTEGFLEVSLGRYAEALAVLDPLLAAVARAPGSMEIISSWFLPDAVEAMVELGRLEDAAGWVDLMESNGIRLDRAWLLAVAGRCRGMLQAARDDLDGALEATERAMTQHDRVPMPFERARTQLFLGQLQRKLRRRDDAATSLGAALADFERLGTPLWARRARDELALADGGPPPETTLTPSELRVARLAASGMTNRDVAANLYMSPKTVEAKLSRVYRKLHISSRAELGSRMDGVSD